MSISPRQHLQVCRHPGEAGTPAEGGALPPASPTSLEPSQTSPEVVDRTRYLSCDEPEDWPFVHRGWVPTRLKVREAMIQNGMSPERVWKFDHCHDSVFIYEESVTGELAERGNHCMDRFCLVCGQARSRNIASALAERCGKAPLFITLTVRGKPGDSLAGQLLKLKEAWKRLRDMPIWKSVRGGAAMLEIKHTGHWHPHLHIIAEGGYMPQADLSRAWNTCTGDSHRVDIRRVKNVEHAANYVAKYASKPMDASFTKSVPLLREAMTALKGQRLVACFGTWYGTPLNEEMLDEEPPIFTQWRCLGIESDMRARAAKGHDAEAINVLSRLDRQRSLGLALTERCRGPDANRPPLTTDA